jgi:multimeric flavodoxin WrbA
MLKVVAVNGSPRKDGNTARLLKLVLREVEKEGIQTELLHTSGKTLRGCTGCYKCEEKKDMQCVQNDDGNHFIGKLLAADGIVLGSPVYFADLTPSLKAVIERTGLVALANGNPMRRKVGAAVVAVRRGGAIHTFDSINHLFGILQMVVPGSTYWNMGVGGEPGDVDGDEEGVQNMKNLGQNIAWLMKATSRK